MTRHQKTIAPDIQLPSLPEIALRALEACRRDDNYRQISDIISADTGLVARLLALANSAVYGRPGEILSVEQALLRLGTNHVHTLVMTAALRQLLFDLGADQWQQLRDFWRHSLTTALTAKALATLTRYPTPDEAFLLGILHNIGELIALKTQDEELRQQYLRQQNDIGAELVLSWGLGPMAADAMRYQQAQPGEIQDASHLVKLINLATRLALSDAAGVAAAVKVFDLNEELTREIRIRIDREVEALASSLAIPLETDYDGATAQRALRDTVIRQTLASEALSLSAFDETVNAALVSAVGSLTLLTGLPSLSFSIAEDGLTLLARSHGPVPSMVVSPSPAHSTLTRAFAQTAPVAPDDSAPTVLDRQLLNLLGTPSLLAIPVGTGGPGNLGVLVLGANSKDAPSHDLALLFVSQLAERLEQLRQSGDQQRWNASVETDELRRQVHEISNPLTIVRQYIYQLRSKLDHSDVQEELDVIRDELERAGKLLLQIGRPLRSPQEELDSAASLNDEIKPLYNLFEDTLFSADNLSLSVELCAQPTQVLGSRAGIRQLIINLVKNAAEAMPQGGAVVIRTAAPVWQNGRQWVEVLIEDSGPGLPDEIQKQLFRPLKSTKGSGHSGLGLSITKQLVDGMEGIISCRTGDAGTLFRVLLPRGNAKTKYSHIDKDGYTAMTRDFQQPFAPNGQTADILVVDDDQRLLTSLATLLRQAGYNVTEALGGHAACETLKNQSFHLAMLDLRMPDIDGFDVMAYAASAQPSCGVIVVSGEGAFTSVSRALRRGALDYIKKPFDPEELLETVRNVLCQQSLLRDHADVQTRLKKSEALHRYIVNSSPDIVFMLDQDGRICFINNKVNALLGYLPSELIGQHFSVILDEHDIARGTYAIQDMNVTSENPRTLEVRMKTRGSRRANRHFEISAFPIDPDTWPRNHEREERAISQNARFYGTARDVTERKEAEAFINFQAYHDLLTRLPNRALFKDRLNLAITHARRNNQKLAVMFLDLDRFKVINDTLGHAMGDRLLQAVTQRLEDCLRKGDTLSRFGGDEFTLLLPAIHREDDAKQIAQKLIDALDAPFRLGEHEVFVGISIGIAVFPDAGESLDQLIQNADIAMYNVKGKGKGDYRFYSQSMSIDTANRLSLERDLRLALDRNELRVFYQPQVCTQSGRVAGIEALVRWQHPERGLLYPADFLPLAEETKLIDDLSERVLAMACEQVGEWVRNGHPDLRLAVNLSPIQVEHPHFVDTLIQQLQSYDFPAKNLEIEITENVIMTDLEHISQKLKELADYGIRIAIDDFGTGYSSLNYLHRLPIHTLKVDQSFVRDIRNGDDGACIVNAIVAMAHGLRLDIVAEGVETDAQLHYLRKLGCQQVQGFFYGPPRPAENIEPLLKQDHIQVAAV